VNATLQTPLASWHVADDPSALVVRLARPCRVASFAPLGGGLRNGVEAIVNHGVARDERRATDEPELHLAAVARRLGLDPATTVGLMTGVEPRRVRSAAVTVDGLTVLALVTAGLANALRVGDPATAPSEVAGTINLILVVDAPLRDEALLECLSLATEARTLACLDACLPSRVSGRIATGTGTDCIAVATPGGERALRYAGKHTRVGELVGRAVLEAVGLAIRGAAAGEGR
jgi:adenosylcobinamide amidohydrolase